MNDPERTGSLQPMIVDDVATAALRDIGRYRVEKIWGRGSANDKTPTFREARVHGCIPKCGFG
jgi:hypothetical protein